jgi:hypothetical protein
MKWLLAKTKTGTIIQHSASGCPQLTSELVLHTWVGNPGLPLTSSVTLDKFINCTKVQFPCL